MAKASGQRKAHSPAPTDSVYVSAEFRPDYVFMVLSTVPVQVYPDDGFAATLLRSLTDTSVFVLVKGRRPGDGLLVLGDSKAS